jgi:hypothetical protein
MEPIVKAYSRAAQLFFDGAPRGRSASQGFSFQPPRELRWGAFAKELAGEKWHSYLQSAATLAIYGCGLLPHDSDLHTLSPASAGLSLVEF